jgi:hypothetical protein
MRYRLAVPDDIDGMLLQATVLGYIGDVEGASGAHEEAFRVLADAVRSNRCAAWRLYGLAAARTGRWRQSLRAARALRAAHGTDRAAHSRDVARLVREAMVAASKVDNAAVLAVAAAAKRLAPSRHLKWVERAQARAFAATGDVVGVRRVLALPAGTIPVAAADRVLLARALVEAGDAQAAVPLLRPSLENLKSPDDLLFAADTAIAGGDRRAALSALDSLSRLEGQAARAARLAIAALSAADEAHRVRAVRDATGAGGLVVGSSASVWRDLQPVSSPRPLSPATLVS